MSNGPQKVTDPIFVNLPPEGLLNNAKTCWVSWSRALFGSTISQKPANYPQKNAPGVKRPFSEQLSEFQAILGATLSWEVLNGVGVDGVGVIFPFF